MNYETTNDVMTFTLDRGENGIEAKEVETPHTEPSSHEEELRAALGPARYAGHVMAGAYSGAVSAVKDHTKTLARGVETYIFNKGFALKRGAEDHIESFRRDAYKMYHAERELDNVVEQIEAECN